MTDPGNLSTDSGLTSEQAVRDIIHRTNNFLTVIDTQGECALLLKDTGMMEKALHSILQESEKMHQFLQDTRGKLEE